MIGFEQHPVGRPVSTRAPRRAALASITGIFAAAIAPRSQAQAWPGGKTIRIVSSSAAGGATDILTRAFADWLARDLGIQVIVDNRPGANGLVATGEIARAQPDGLTLLVSYAGATVSNKLMMAKPAVDPLGITPIGHMGAAGAIILVNSDVPVKNLRELAAYAAPRPGLSYASWGIGSGGHLVMEFVKQQTGMQLNHVPYKGSPQIATDLISGVLSVATMDSQTPLPHIATGRMRAIAAISQRRLPQLPDVATLSEQGVPYESPSWWGLFGPLGTPREIVDRLNASVNRWLVLPETITYFEQKVNAPKPIPMTPGEFEKSIANDLVNWKRLIDAAGLPQQ